MTTLLSADISNWDSPTAENSAACMASACSAPPVIRASLESAGLGTISVNQIDAFEKAGRSTMVYAWASAVLTPQQNADRTIALIGGHSSTKVIWLDVEDYSNFFKNPTAYVPKRLLATLIANGLSPAILEAAAAGMKVPLDSATLGQLQSLTLASVSQSQAVAWIRAWVTEVGRLGYTPGIYSAPGVWNDLCGGDTSFGDVAGWGAAWVNSPIVVPPVPWGGITNWWGVQYLPGGLDPTMCGMALDLDSWDSTKLGITPPTPPPPPVNPTGPYVSQADFDRLNTVLVWRLKNLQAALSNAAQYLDPNSTPPE